MCGIICSKLRVFLLIIIFGFISQIFLLPWSKIVKAETLGSSWSWSSSEPSVFSSTGIADPNSWCGGFFQNEKIDGQSNTQKICMSSRGDIKFGVYFNGNAFLPVVGFPLDDQMYRLNGVCRQYDDCVYLPGSDTLATKQYLINGLVRSLVVYKNFSRRLSKIANASSTEYNFDRTNPNYIFKSESGYAWPIGSFGASDDGDWLAIEFRQRGIGLLDINTLKMKRISTMSYSYGTGYDPASEIAVSNGGKHVAIMGFNSGFSIFDVKPDCGDEALDSKMEMVSSIDRPCKTAPINTDTFISRFYAAFNPRFTENGGGLSFYTYSYIGEWREISLRASGYAGQQIDYLALGDSFTSGEGETSDSYYLAGTNDQNEKCHVSMRSYPFLISDFMNIEPLNMASVACSGATTTDVLGANSDYWGQGGRLKDKTNPNKSEKTIAQSNALHSFLPGRIHQETFAKEYSPKVITIGIGGNDAGLMEKLSACAGKNTCNWASEAKSKEQTADEIKGLFGTLVKTYQGINAASPKSKIYAIGYPKIIDQDGKCDVLTGFLFDETERHFMNESIIYLNQVVAAAAKSAGIKYIDIQDSYGDHVLCGDKSPSAMNGAVIGDDNQYNWFLNIGNESFHPNSLGHSYDAKAINESVANLLNYSYCNNGVIICPDSTVAAPEPSSYWIPSVHHDYPEQHIANYVTDREDSTDNRQKKLMLDNNSLQPDSTFDIEITSDPISLGHFTASANGSLDINIDLPIDLEEGYHTVHLYGTSYSGEPIELYQVIQYKKPMPRPIEQTTISNAGIAYSSTSTESTVPNIQKIDDISNNVIGGTDKAIEQIATPANPEVKGASIVVNQPSTLTRKSTDDNAINDWLVYLIFGSLSITMFVIIMTIIFHTKKNNR